jgi:hypothetical protein
MGKFDFAEIGVELFDRRRCSVLAVKRMSYILSTATKVFLEGSGGGGVDANSPW